jgi:hypothetical protein
MVRKTEKIKTIEELAKLSGSLMKTTARVGAPDEDASMAKARPRLAKINTLGFITTDSQMGLKQEYDSVVEKHRGVMWQRSYVTGFMSREKAVSFKLYMDLVGGAAVHVCEFSKKGPTNAMFSNAYRVPATRFTMADGTFKSGTNVPFISTSIEENWLNLLPETGLSRDTDTRDIIAPHVVAVQVVDMTWGRPTWLFKNVIEVLSGKSQRVPKAKKRAKK